MLDVLGFLSVISASTASFLNLMLLPIIALRSGKHIGSYKVLLFLNTLVATFFSANHAITIPAFYVEDGKYIVYSSNTSLPVAVSHVLVVTMALAFIIIIISLAISFAYRLSVMTNKPDPIWFHSAKGIVPITMVALLACTAAVASILAALAPSHERTVEMAEGFRKQTGFNLYAVGYIGGHLYDSNSGRIVFGVLVHMLVYGIITTTGISIMSYSTIKIMKTLRSSLSMMERETKTMLYQRKLFSLLVFQAIFPFVFTLSPPLLCYTFTFFQINVGSFPSHLGAGMALATVAEPLLVVYFIQDYRAVIKNICRGRILPKSILHSTVVPVTNAHAH